jgi:REP-associated tyrosine transposase
MHFEVDNTYHIYNRSNETVFYNDDNYLYFLSKVKLLIKPYAHILSWCLMPNHFHFLIVAKKEGCELVNEKHRPNVQVLSKNIGTLLSSYTKAINKSNKRRGKLFAHNTQAKCLNHELNSDSFLENCFHYIHQNPVMAGLCSNIRDWEHSSFNDYAGLRSGELVNKKLAFEMINFDNENFETQSNILIEERNVKGMF